MLYYRNNLNTLMNLLDCMTEFNVKGIVFSSSCTVYGEPDENPVTEAAPIKKATSPYGNTKQISEEIITDVMVHGLDMGFGQVDHIDEVTYAGTVGSGVVVAEHAQLLADAYGPLADTMRSAWAWQCRLRERGIM